MMQLRAKIDEAVACVRRVTDVEPAAAIVLGTGLGDLSGIIDDPVAIDYEDIPHLPSTGVESHAGQMIIGRIADRPVVVMRGRVHFYEGYSMSEVTFGVRVMHALGARNLILNSAVGGMNPLHPLGSIVLVDDHINLMGDNPLIGPNDESLGPRFPDMSDAYSAELKTMVRRIAVEERIRIENGVLVAVAGPNLETRAEYRFLRAIGADIVGMSTVPECIVGAHAGMRVLAFGVVTDVCLPDTLEPVDIARILQVAAGAEPNLTRLVARAIAGL